MKHGGDGGGGHGGRGGRRCRFQDIEMSDFADPLMSLISEKREITQNQE